MCQMCQIIVNLCNYVGFINVNKFSINQADVCIAFCSNLKEMKNEKDNMKQFVPLWEMSDTGEWPQTINIIIISG